MTIVFDLDNTICVTNEELPLAERYVDCTVKPQIREFINRLYDKGHIICIDTARGSSYHGLKGIYMKRKIKKHTSKQLNEWGVKYHRLRVGTKIPADLYIDDKSIHPKVFDGTK